MTGKVALLGSLRPAAFFALTLNSYSLPLSSPFTVYLVSEHGRSLAVFQRLLLGSLYSMTYPWIFLPPSDLGLSQLRVTADSSMSTGFTLPGASGLAGNKILVLNPHVTNGLSHPYHLDEYTFILRGFGDCFFIFISFFDENHVSKQNSPRWDAAFCQNILQYTTLPDITSNCLQICCLIQILC